MTDWAKEPYARGGYSTLSAAELPGARAAYRAPEWDGALCFAGEATQVCCARVGTRRAARRAARALTATGPRRTR